MLRQLATRQNFITKLEGPCSHCASVLSWRWRKSKADGSITCDSCYVYARKHGTPRPEKHISKRKLQGPCSNCATERPYGAGKPSRSMWGQNESGLVLCVLCYRYGKRTGKPRPEKLIQKSQNAWYRLPKASQRTLDEKGVCHNCSVTESPLGWVHDEDDKSLCHECDLSINGGEKSPSIERIAENLRLRKFSLRGPCTNCHTDVSPRWLRDKEGSPLCQACSHYANDHDGKHRPAELIAKSKKRGEGVVSPARLQGPCSRCDTKIAIRFAKGKNGDLLCGTCDDYLRNNKTPRPMELIIMHKRKTESLEKERAEYTKDHASSPAAKRQRQK